MESPITNHYAAAQRFVSWLVDTVIERARGANRNQITGKPTDRFWLGRLAPTQIAAGSATDPRMERLEPCQIGFQIRPCGLEPWLGQASASFYLWRRFQSGSWTKIGPIEVEIPLAIDTAIVSQTFGATELQRALQSATGRTDLSAEVLVEKRVSEAGPELSITLVNTSLLDDGQDVDPRFYEATLRISDIDYKPFLLDNLEDSFRYDRTIGAYGINGGVFVEKNGLRTTDSPYAMQLKPDYWGSNEPPPDFSFAALARDPIAVGEELSAKLGRWGEEVWSAETLARRAATEDWSAEMFAAAQTGATQFGEELQRIETGVRLLAEDPRIRQAFVLMNEAMAIVGQRKSYYSWRPFQVGFLLANLGCLRGGDAENDIVDIVWFATSGGKTETYLGLLIAAAFYDRLRGKLAGCTAWSRFPLRLLSLQQMQRFADALAAAEMVRRRHKVAGRPFSLGFLVGDGATPNRLRRPEQERESHYDPDEPGLPDRFRMLQRCPFCGDENLAMGFDTGTWTLQHRCTLSACPWPETALPFHIVDEEVFRFLPTIVVGTLDKVALIGMQQAMRGLVAAPRGLCPLEGHGFTYNPSARAPSGCLVPDCAAIPEPLPFAAELFAPSIRLQDELHLLRDSLGAVDAHYEAALDGLQGDLVGLKPKILASSATLSGYRKQVDVLYRRRARVFPQPPPWPSSGFWSKPSGLRMRDFVAIAPRGATVEFAVDRLLNELQVAVRRLISEPERVCREIGVDSSLADFLLDQYGTDVIYGNTLRDLDAVARSSGTQLVDVPGDVNMVPLTGRTQFEEVSSILNRLEKTDPTRPFEERIHVIPASSMMSHGVDVDRLNVMVVLGVPLTTSEFIQATARVGRKWPAVVFVVHKMARERDAGVFRSFEKFVEHGDRLVEPIPITDRSRRVLERTLSGLEMARLLHIHAPAASGRFTTASAVRAALSAGELHPEEEAEAIAAYLAYDPETEEEHIADIRDGLDRYWERLRSPQISTHEWFGSVWRMKPMRSLRDVEEQVPVHLKR